MNLDTRGWKEFYLKNLYDIKMGNGFDKDKMSEDDAKVNFVSRISYNNGVDIKVDAIEGVDPFPAGMLTVALGGSYLGSCFVQEEPFYTGQNVAVMSCRDASMSHTVNLFVTVLVRYESKIKYYAFGRELNTHIGRDFTIMLPIQYKDNRIPVIDESKRYSEDGYVPDWKFMEEYIALLHHKPLTTKINKCNTDFDILKWKSFAVNKILTIMNGKGITKEEIEENEGSFVVVQSGEKNNGVIGKIDLDYCKSMKYTYTIKSCLTVARSGCAGFVSFQIGGCVVGDSAKILLLDDAVATTEHYLFIQAVLMANKFKYAYGRKVTEEKYMNDYIDLPIKYKEDGNPFIDEHRHYSEEGYVPDWKFMEKYIKSLPYGDRL